VLDRGITARNISMDMSIIISTIGRAIMGRCRRVANNRRNIAGNFKERRCMTRTAMRPHVATGRMLTR